MVVFDIESSSLQVAGCLLECKVCREFVAPACVAGLERCVDRSELNQRSTQRTGPRAPKRTH